MTTHLVNCYYIAKRKFLFLIKAITSKFIKGIVAGGFLTHSNAQQPLVFVTLTLKVSDSSVHTHESDDDVVSSL